jgi:DNA polymerase I-like protein with 3'-5' exonuclease and polymerase domains
MVGRIFKATRAAQWNAWMLFEGFNPNERIVIDVETISWDDTRGGLRPYHGDRVAGVSLVQKDKTLYLPLRHRTDVDGCLPFDYAIEQLRKFCAELKIVTNLNVKFDRHCLLQDGVTFPKAKFEPLEVRGRLVRNNLMEYNLEALCARYNKNFFKQGEEVDRWLREHCTQDYGAVPIPIMQKYAIRDGLAAYELAERFDALLQPESLPVWEEEQKFFQYIFKAESEGFEVDKDFLLLAQAKLCTNLDLLAGKIQELAGFDLNPASPIQVNEYFLAQGVEPVHFNEQDDGTKTNSWGKEALTQIIHPMANLLMKYNNSKVAYGTFALGWYNEIAPDGKIHAHFNQSGTKTGRLSSSTPNLQNTPEWIYKAIRIPDGYVGLKYDYSQIEYRIFAEYSNDAALMQLYFDNPRTDFHQIVADRLHVPKHRGMVKPVNFGIIYGMGQGKTKRQLAKTIHDANDPELMDYLSRTYGQGGGDLQIIANNFLQDYHTRTPAIKKLQKEIKRAICERGCLRNMFGRIYYIDVDHSYIGLNYLCQEQGQTS